MFQRRVNLNLRIKLTVAVGVHRDAQGAYVVVRCGTKRHAHSSAWSMHVPADTVAVARALL